MLFGLWYSNKKTTKLTKTINITVEIKISFVCKLKLAKRFLEKSIILIIQNTLNLQ